MNIAVLCALIIVAGETNGFHVENSRTSNKEEPGQRILLRKLHNFQRDDPKETKIATWNQILANALVNRIKIFSFNVADNIPNDVKVKSNLLTNCISQLMYIYKTYIYDKFHKRIDPNITDDAHTESSKETKQIKDDSENKGAVESERNFTNPKDEVEIVEPKYHGKLCVNCEANTKSVETAENGVNETVEIVEKVETVTGCPEGLVTNGDGSCTAPKSKFILSIPYQCPNGYRRDWLGVCRPPF